MGQKEQFMAPRRAFSCQPKRRGGWKGVGPKGDTAKVKRVRT